MLLHIYCTKALVVKLYYNTYICQLWSGDSKQISDKAIKALNLKHFIMKLFKLKVELKAKLELAIIIPPTLLPTEAWGGVRLLVTRGGLERSFFMLLAKAACPDLGLGLLPWPAPLWWPVHQNSQRKTQPHSMHSTGHRWEPQAAVGHRVGGIIIANSRFALNLTFNLKSFMMKCLRHFFAGSTKEIYQSLKLVSVHYRNKAWIKNIGVHSF